MDERSAGGRAAARDGQYARPSCRKSREGGKAAKLNIKYIPI